MTQAFNLSQLANNVNSSGLLNAAAGLYNQVPVANGGTGVATVASGNLLVGAGTAAMTALAGSSTGDVVTWSGTAWAAAASAGGPAPVVRVYTSPSPWTKPATLKGIKVTILGGGGSGAAVCGTSLAASGGGSAGGGTASFTAPAIPGPVTVTVGSGGSPVTQPLGPNVGTNGNSGGTSSFGALISATGGGGGVWTPNAPATGGSAGSFTPSSTALGLNGLAAPLVTNPGTGGIGANTWFGNWGFAGAGSSIGGTPGSAGTGYGSGGGGQRTVSNSQPSISGGGTQGFIVVEEFY